MPIGRIRALSDDRAEGQDRSGGGGHGGDPGAERLRRQMREVEGPASA